MDKKKYYWELGGKNTWEYVNQLRASSGRPPIQPDHNESPVDSFIKVVKSDNTPEPEILFAIAECFDQYFKEGGNLGLEEIFWGVTTTAGNCSGQRLQGDYWIRETTGDLVSVFEEFHSSITDQPNATFHLANGNQIAKAEDFLKQLSRFIYPKRFYYSEDNASGFVRRYQEWKSKKHN
jgi:hypothetical protein